MKTTQRLLCVVTFLLSFVTMSAQTWEGLATVKVNESTAIMLGDTYSRILRTKATAISYRWYSSDTSVASVSYSSYMSCSITGKSFGSCKVYFSASFYIDGFYRTYDFYWDITVSSYTGGQVIDPVNVTLSPTELTLEVGETYKNMSYVVYPANATYTLEWACYNATIATVDVKSGEITAVGPGKTLIHLWVFDSKGGNNANLIKTCSLTVVPKSIKELQLMKDSLVMERGTEMPLQYSLLPEDAGCSTLNFESSDEAIASIDENGLIIAHNRGNCTITVSTTDGSNLSDSCKLHVQATRILDENSTEFPLAEDDVDVTVLRTLKANEWNTIWLPFDMTEEQVVAALGEDVKIGDYMGSFIEFHSTPYGNTFYNQATVCLYFRETTVIKANIPYIIKASKDMQSFHIEHVNIKPIGSTSVFACREGDAGIEFKGSWAIGELGKKMLINDRTFVLTTEADSIKSLSGFFVFPTDAEKRISEQDTVRFLISFGGNVYISHIIPTRIHELRPKDLEASRGRNFYTIDGKYAYGIKPKGIYIINGKKVFKK